MTSERTNLFHRMWMVGFAGHRRVEDPAMSKAVIRRELDAMAASLNGELIGVSSAAAGADLLFLEACAEAGLRTVVILPFRRELFERDFEDPEEWRRAETLMDAALWCEVAPGGEEAPAAYHRVAREMLELADRMIFLWDGQPPRGLGGTGETVREAAEWGIPARIIDAATFESRWQTGEPEEKLVDPAFSDLPAARDVRSLFEKLDARAVAGAPKSRWFAAGSMSVNHVATFLQASLLALSLAREMGALLKFCLALLAAWLPWVGARLRLQERWVSDRVRAELLRSILASHEPGSPLSPPALDLFDRDQAFIRSAALYMVPGRRGWEEARDHYLVERLDGQIGYLRAKGDVARRRMKFFGKLFWTASWGAMLFAGIVVFSNLLEADVPRWWSVWGLGFLPAILPGVAAWSLAMISVFEFKRRAGLYKQLVGELERLRPKLAAAQCASAAAAAMHQIERLLLNELWEWQGPRRK